MSVFFALLMACGESSVESVEPVPTTSSSTNTEVVQASTESISSADVMEEDTLRELWAKGECDEFKRACLKQGMPEEGCLGRYEYCKNQGKSDVDGGAQERRRMLWKLSLQGKCDLFKSECLDLQIPEEQCVAGYQKCQQRKNK